MPAASLTNSRPEALLYDIKLQFTTAAALECVARSTMHKPRLEILGGSIPSSLAVIPL